ncbi:MAG: sugar-binding transcriptional regulator [Arthrobacter sp.]|jgi:DNA-binding transcriptional regulator LsrR (DeoR family)|nr:sugar-binding transcriptional regulator [Arthrobacter sp.]
MNRSPGGTNEQQRRAAMLLSIAKGYYEEQRTMDSLARDWGVSRSTVSRALSEARERGIVEIRLHDPTHGVRDLAHLLSARHGVRFTVVPTIVGDSPEQELDRVASVAASVVAHLVRPNSVVGLAWGTTVRALSQRLGRHPMNGLTFVQLNGAGSPTSTGEDYAASILRRFADAYDGSLQSFPVPAFFDDPAARELLWRERSISRIVNLQRKMHLMIAGIGSLNATVTSHLYDGDFLDEEDYRLIEQEGVVGDIATRFFRADGTHDGIALNARSTGPTFDTLSTVPLRLGVVHGRGKVPGLLGALRADLFTHVVVDETAARSLAGAGAEPPAT